MPDGLLRRDGRELLLLGLRSWLHRRDVHRWRLQLRMPVQQRKPGLAQGELRAVHVDMVATAVAATAAVAAAQP